MSILESDDDQIYVCGECGGEEVYEAVWMEINGTGGGEPVGNGENWCADCDNSHPFTYVVTKEEYLLSKKEEEEKTLP